MNTNLPQIFVGIDIAKDFLDVHIKPMEKSFRISNDAKGLKKLLNVLSRYEVIRVAYEPSGGWEYHLAKALSKKGYKHWAVNPKRIRAFRISEGINAKNDKIDAAMIALFASQKEPNYIKMNLSEDDERLLEIIKYRNELKRTSVQEQHRLNMPMQIYCKKAIKKHLEFINAQIKHFDKEIENIVKNNKRFSEKESIISSVPGVGPVTASTLIGSFPEIGLLNSKEAASLAGLAPHIQQSGSSKGIAAISGGRGLIRSMLYMASLSAIKHNYKLKAFYERLRESGKSYKKAITAVMRKLLVIINAMVAHNESWRTA